METLKSAKEKLTADICFCPLNHLNVGTYPYLFEYNAQNFVLIFNQKLRVRVIDENCSVLLEIRQNYFGNCRNILLLM